MSTAPKIKIVTDSGSDIPLGLAHELGIEIVPMYIHMGDQTFRAGLDITNEPFYQSFHEHKPRVTTSSPPPVVFEQTYRRLSGDYDFVYSIHTSARLSSTLHSAQQAKSKLPASATRIEILDSKLASMSLGLVAIHAARAVRDGITPEDCARLINQLIQHCHMVFFVDTIEYLEHGGRLAMAQSVLGSMQRIKPLMLLDEGEIVPYERTRTRAKAIEGLFTFIEDFPKVEEVIAMYATTPEDVEKLMEKVDPIFPRDQIQTMQFSPSIGAHLGPGAMGVAVFEGIAGVTLKRALDT